jgi:hypothetical protein
MNSEGKEKSAVAFCLYQDHFPSALCQVIALYCLIQEMPFFCLVVIP